MGARGTGCGGGGGAMGGGGGRTGTETGLEGSGAPGGEGGCQSGWQSGYQSGCWWSGLCLRGERRGGFVTPTETGLRRDALCFMVKTWARHNTTEAVLNNGGRLAAVGSWWLAVVGGWWR